MAILNTIGNTSRTVVTSVLLFVLVIGVAVGHAKAQTIETTADHAYLVDFETGAVLLDKMSNERMYPASMTKMMTVYLLMQRLKDGRLSLDDTLSVSEKAWRKGGSKMWVEVGKQVRVEDLIRGIVVQSGNDATIVVAEGLAGTEDAFAREMTATAHKLGMSGTQFKNASGWPDPEHYTTAHDLAVLAISIIRDFPEMYHYFAETEFAYNGIKQQNRNPLLYKDIGADGLKTGHTEDSGYGLVGSAVRDGRRLVVVLNGMSSTSERAQESEKLLNWGFREWNSYALFNAGETVMDAKVWLGSSGTVPLVVEEDVSLTMRRRARNDLKVTVRYDEPIAAPIAAGTQVASLVVTAPGVETLEVPLKAGADIEQLGPVGRLTAAVNFLVWGESE
ncbi:D-alanyl-D-alanine carboxypeptidase [Hwanghaeella grinnelliae]|uniref:serine-type D-Ala-D-Ala carboxypeptidase n=1 Tax=Hwanghaeella grinnelliae TaxID=2500179 RepID=A0A3S2Y630_9PROT|nr:D-alanyl-D-alanine carboxypeptidase family protein [Hwanghaeella grinnelliae]RVU39386.1 D-alanyl-D-alanine carboxypeptidase [Hwanghaeella grinnelliae]